MTIDVRYWFHSPVKKCQTRTYFFILNKLACKFTPIQLQWFHARCLSVMSLIDLCFNLRNFHWLAAIFCSLLVLFIFYVLAFSNVFSFFSNRTSWLWRSTRCCSTFLPWDLNQLRASAAMLLFVKWSGLDVCSFDLVCGI